MANTIVTHRTYGTGIVKSVNVGKNKIAIDFDWRGIREFGVQAFDLGILVVRDTDFNKKLNSIRRKLARTNPKLSKAYGRDSFFDGGRAEDITFNNNNEFYEAIGYIAKNAKFIEAEVSQDREELFNEMFGEMSERYVHRAVDNNRNQFRIDFTTTENMPTVLEHNLIEACGTGRLAKSLFVEKLIKKFGFRFGAEQNIENIRNMAKSGGYLADFERGFNR